MKIRPILQKAGLVFVSVLLSLLVVEFVLRWVYPAQVRYLVWQPNLHHTFYPDTSVLHGVDPISKFTINPYGVRMDTEDEGQLDLYDSSIKTPNPCRYLCLGGSTTECLYLDDDSAWPMRVKRAAGRFIPFVGNIGKSGCTSRENYIQLKYCVSQYKNVDGAILMVGLNDMLKRLSQDSNYTPLQFTPASEDSLARATLLRQGRNIGSTWWRRTAIFYLVQQALHRKNPTGVKWENVEDDRAEIYKTWRKKREHACRIIDSLPNLTSSLNEFGNNIKLIINEARKQHLNIIFINQTAIWKDSMPQNELAMLWMGGIGNFQQAESSAYYSPAALRRALTLYNEKLSDVCRDNGVEMINLDASIPHDASVFYDDCHFTNLGAKKVAGLIVRQLYPYRK